MRFNRSKYYFVGLMLVLWTVIGLSPATAQPTWTQLSPIGGPPHTRDSHNAVFDPGSNRMIVFGGTEATSCCGPLLNDVWVLTNADGTGPQVWTQLSPTGTPPAPRAMSAAVYDPATNRMIIYGGDPNSGNCFGAVNDV